MEIAEGLGEFKMYEPHRLAEECLAATLMTGKGIRGLA